MKVTNITRLIDPNPFRTHLIIQNLTDENLYIREIESSDITDYTDNGVILKINGIFEDYGRYKGAIYGYAANECDVRVIDLSEVTI